MSKLSNYISASIAEMKKVTWPSKKETYRYTILVIAISLGVAAFLGIMDYVFNIGLATILK